VTKKVQLTDLERLGSNVRRKRIMLGLSMAQLAFELETSEKQISRIELGQVNSGIITYLKLCRVLNLSVNELFYKITL
jgi:transcriptional regulator with XRE-family HTH domain